jgi:hypothetical protein
LKYLSWIAGSPDDVEKTTNPYLIGAAVVGVVVLGAFAVFSVLKKRK